MPDDSATSSAGWIRTGCRATDISFDPRGPDVRLFEAPPEMREPMTFDRLYYVSGRWVRHTGRLFKLPYSFGSILSDSEAMDWFLAHRLELPSELQTLANSPAYVDPLMVQELRKRFLRHNTAPAESFGEASTPTKAKKSTGKGDARAKIIAALTKHHQYDNGSCLNTEPISVNELARQAEVSKSSVSDFFRRKFKGENQATGHQCYKAVCRNAGRLADSLKALNEGFSPHELYGRRPPNEDDRDEADE